jgi:hypothetical protein
MVPYIKHDEIIANLKSQPPPSHLPLTDTNRGTGALLSVCISEPWERDSQGCLEMKVHTSPSSLLATNAEMKYIQCGIKKKGMKTYSENLLKEEITTLCF